MLSFDDCSALVTMSVSIDLFFCSSTFALVCTSFFYSSYCYTAYFPYAYDYFFVA